MYYYIGTTRALGAKRRRGHIDFVRGASRRALSYPRSAAPRRYGVRYSSGYGTVRYGTVRYHAVPVPYRTGTLLYGTVMYWYGTVPYGKPTASMYCRAYLTCVWVRGIFAVLSARTRIRTNAQTYIIVGHFRIKDVVKINN